MYGVAECAVCFHFPICLNFIEMKWQVSDIFSVLWYNAASGIHTVAYMHAPKFMFFNKYIVSPTYSQTA